MGGRKGTVSTWKLTVEKSVGGQEYWGWEVENMEGKHIINGRPSRKDNQWTRRYSHSRIRLKRRGQWMEERRSETCQVSITKNSYAGSRVGDASWGRRRGGRSSEFSGAIESQNTNPGSGDVNWGKLFKMIINSYRYRIFIIRIVERGRPLIEVSSDDVTRKRLWAWQYRVSRSGNRQLRHNWG